MGKHKIWDSLDRDCIQAIGCPILGCSSFVEKQQFRTIDLKLPSFESPNTLLRLGAYSNAESTGGVSIGNGIIPPPATAL